MGVLGMGDIGQVQIFLYLIDHRQWLSEQLPLA
jgi:hypothetical protein